MTEIGTIIAPTESGWKRIDDIDPMFKYVGNWVRKNYPNSYSNYNNTWIESTRIGDYVEFKTTSTNVKIYAYGNHDTSGFEVFVDDVSYGIVKTNYGIPKVLFVHEIANLRPGKEKTIRLVILNRSLFPGSSTTRLLFDAIDVYQDNKLMLFESSNSYYNYNFDVDNFNNLDSSKISGEALHELMLESGLSNEDIYKMNKSNLMKLGEDTFKIRAYRFNKMND